MARLMMTMVDGLRAIKKVCMLGDPAVGKTSLIRRYCLNEFDRKYATTTGMRVLKKQVEFERSATPVHLTLMIHDIIGQPGYAEAHKFYFKGVEAALAVCDITRRSTLDNLKHWLSILSDLKADVPIVFAANKGDLVKDAEFSIDELVESYSLDACETFLTSAKSGKQVEDAFVSLGKLAITDILG